MIVLDSCTRRSNSQITSMSISIRTSTHISIRMHISSSMRIRMCISISIRISKILPVVC